jgi:hypothetical protein
MEDAKCKMDLIWGKYPVLLGHPCSHAYKKTSTSSPLNLNHPIIVGTNQMNHQDLATKRGVECLDEEYVKEIFEQLWAIPKLDNPRVPDPHPSGGCLVWIRRDLVREERVRQSIVSQ